MRVKFKGRWTREQVNFCLSGFINSLEEDGVEYFVSLNLYFHAEDSDFDSMQLLTEDDYPVEVIVVENPHPPVRPVHSRKPRKTRLKAPVIDIADFRRSKEGA